MGLAFDHLHRGRKVAEAAPPNLIHEFFERQADQRPSHLAVECKGETLTYAQLDRQSNQIAHFLRRQGIGPEFLVGIYLRKSCRLFAAMLGVLKAGAGYVPIDPHTPAERVRLIADDAKLTLLLTEDLLLPQLGADSGIALTSLDHATLEIARQPKSRLPGESASLTASNVCYVIYTSGSTGRPKGVVLEHQNVANYIAAMRAHYRVGKDDRVYQGFSVAFDASVEEIWAAFANGGTLVVAPEDVAKSPHEAADFISSRKLTVFSTVPTFLSLITAELPSVGLIIVGGEACPAQLVARWANGKRRMLNTYGPTETAVVATISQCVPGEAVSIGTAMAGYSTRVLDDELHDVGVGEVGELYIGGKSLARGYMNLPDLTAENFLTLPCQFHDGIERLYRTRDLVRLTQARTLEFIGRADDQVKIRGFRIELSEIEAVLMEHPSVRSAAVAVHEHHNMKEIAAYIVPAGDLGPRQKSGIADLLMNRLPDYMFPKYFEIIDELPAMNSGKVDRKRLPRPTNAFVVSGGVHVAPATAIESEIARVWEEQLDTRHISVEADFFLDLRGNSFTAAHVATELRERLGTIQISSKDLYTYRTVRALARHLVNVRVSTTDRPADPAPASAPKASSMQAMRVNVLTRWTCTFLQTLSIGCFYAVVSAPLIYAILTCERVYKGELSLESAITISTYVSLAIWPSWLVLSIALKWLVIGRYKPGRYPVWGFFYFRWWLVSRFQGIGWPEMFSGTPLMSLYYRAMGAKIGKNCTIGTPLCTAFDLVSVGDDSSIGVDAQLLGYRVENGWLMLGTVDIGRECFVGMQTALGLNVVLQDRSRLEDMSLLPDGTTLPAGAQRAGSPPVEAHVECPESNGPASRRRRGFLFGLLHLALIYVMGYVLILSILPSIVLVWYCSHRWGLVAAGLSVFVAVPLATIWYPTLTILIKRLFIGRIKPGTFPVASVRYLRYWFLDYMMNNTRHLLLPVYATVFLPTFLRLMGARIGKGVEISTIMHVVPDLLDVGEGSFLADACIIGGHRIYRGLIDIRPNRIGRRSFIGNSAVVPGGIDVGKDSLIGVMSTPPVGAPQADGTRWLGSPSFEVPSAPQDWCFGDAQTYHPKAWMRCLRTAFETFRILLPGAITAAEFLIFCVIVICLDSNGPLWLVLAASPLVALYLSLVTLVWVARTKSLLIGTFAPTVRPLWSSFVWLNEVINGVYETVGTAALLPLMGTPYVAMFLRRMGCHIGRWVFLETTLFSEFDLVEIGDCAALNLGSTIQTHLFEDRVMKADRLKIGAGCSVGNMAVVLYGSEMKDGSSLAPLSVLMKGDTLPAQSRWYGIPNQPQDVPPPLAPSLPLYTGDVTRLPRVAGGPFGTLDHAHLD